MKWIELYAYNEMHKCNAYNVLHRMKCKEKNA
jgi:hypothetical protein